MGFTERIISAPGPRNGERIKVETPTTINAFVTSANGAEVSFNMSWDVWVHGHTPIELYGSEGSLKVPDPNFYDGLVQVTQKAGDWQTHDSATRLYGKPNFRSPAWPASRPDRANYRCVGIAEMASAIVRGTPHRSSADLASHTLAVMYAMLESGASAGKGIDIAQGFTQPAPLTEPEAAALWRDNA